MTDEPTAGIDPTKPGRPEVAVTATAPPGADGSPPGFTATIDAPSPSPTAAAIGPGPGCIGGGAGCTP